MRTTLFIAAALVAIPSPGAAHPGHRRARALDDPTIVAIFDGANTADIETGQLAAKRGQSKEVRDFGAMLVRDHAAAMKALRAASNADFDQAFLHHEVAFHKAVIDAVTTTLLPATRNAEFKDLVTKVAPAFQAHMMAADALSKKLQK